MEERRIAEKGQGRREEEKTRKVLAYPPMGGGAGAAGAAGAAAGAGVVPSGALSAKCCGEEMEDGIKR